MWTKPIATLATSLWIGSIGFVLSPTTSWALPCSSLPKPVYVAGSMAAAPLVAAVAEQLTRYDSTPLNVIWQLKSSCGGVEAVAYDTMPGSCATGACITGKAQFWTLDMRDLQPGECDLTATGNKVDVTVTDVAPSTCPGIGAAQLVSLIDTRGPVSAYGVVMAPSAAPTAIHAEEAHFVFGAGKSAGVTPWLNDTAISVFGDKSAGQLLTGQQIKLPPTRWKVGVPAVTADDVVATVYNDPVAGVGILPTTLADKRRNELKVLAFQAIGQRGAYYPDRKSSSFDKQNVRDGHYPLWGYLHTVQRAEPGNPTKPLSVNGARVAAILQGSTPVAGKDGVLLQLQAGLVPQCAMKVTRTSDSAPLAPALPAEPCSCWFEKNVPSGILGCQACLDGKTCSSGKCRRNVCEVQ